MSDFQYFQLLLLLGNDAERQTDRNSFDRYNRHL